MRCFEDMACLRLIGAAYKQVETEELLQGRVKLITELESRSSFYCYKEKSKSENFFSLQEGWGIRCDKYVLLFHHE